MDVLVVIVVVYGTQVVSDSQYKERDIVSLIDHLVEQENTFSALTFVGRMTGHGTTIHSCSTNLLTLVGWVTGHGTTLKPCSMYLQSFCLAGTTQAAVTPEN